VDPVLADRLQFAFTVMFHYLFPIGTMGLAPFVAAYTWKAARGADEELGSIARFLTKIFAINGGVTALTFGIHGVPHHAPWIFVLVLVSLGALVALRVSLRGERPGLAFAMSSCFIVSLLVAAAATIFPYLLPAFPPGRGGMSIYDAAPSPVALACALTVTLAGSVAVLLYSSAVWRRMAGKIRVE
jgi:cytochrome bd-type quinol oxidase subunit 2